MASPGSSAPPTPTQLQCAVPEVGKFKPAQNAEPTAANLKAKPMAMKAKAIAGKADPMVKAESSAGPGFILGCPKCRQSPTGCSQCKKLAGCTVPTSG